MVQTVLKTGDAGSSQYFEADTSLLCLVKGKAREALSCRASHISTCRHPYSGRACKVRRVLPRSRTVQGPFAQIISIYLSGEQH